MLPLRTQRALGESQRDCVTQPEGCEASAFVGLRRDKPSYPGKTSEDNHNSDAVAANLTRAPAENGIVTTALWLRHLLHDDPR